MATNAILAVDRSDKETSYLINILIRLIWWAGLRPPVNSRLKILLSTVLEKPVEKSPSFKFYELT